MPESNSLLGFFGNRYMRLLSAVLILQAAGFYVLSRRESVPSPQPLAEMPTQFGVWGMVREEPKDPEVQAVLQADDAVSRVYSNPSGERGAALFVAYFKSQRSGQAPHSPKNCMPGAGWVPAASEVATLAIPGWPRPVSVNRYLVTKGDHKVLVLYWYQSRDRVVASEYAAKFYLVADAIRYNRTDTALIRVTVPVADDEEAAARTAEDFVSAFFVPLRRFLPA
jgi:EpsI family protein